MIFGEAAEAYHAARPDYPDAVITEIMAYAGPGAEAAVEVGAGTGKATLALAERGAGLLCLEPDPRMAHVLRRTTAHCPRVAIEVVRFERWRPAGRRFGLLLAATAWHWLDPGLRWDLTHRALAPGGTVALMWNPLGIIDPDLYAALAAVDARHGIAASPHDTPAARFGGTPGHWAGEPGWPAAECRADGRFHDLRAHRVRTPHCYDTVGYLRMLDSVSTYRILPVHRRALALRDTARVLDAHGGALCFEQFTDLFLARASR